MEDKIDFNIPNGRMSLPKMSDKSQPFVEKTIDYCATALQFAPP